MIHTPNFEYLSSLKAFIHSDVLRRHVDHHHQPLLKDVASTSSDANCPKSDGNSAEASSFNARDSECHRQHGLIEISDDRCDAAPKTPRRPNLSGHANQNTPHSAAADDGFLEQNATLSSAANGNDCHMARYDLPSSPIIDPSESITGWPGISDMQALEAIMQANHLFLLGDPTQPVPYVVDALDGDAFEFQSPIAQVDDLVSENIAVQTGVRPDDHVTHSKTTDSTQTQPGNAMPCHPDQIHTAPSRKLQDSAEGWQSSNSPLEWTSRQPSFSGNHPTFHLDHGGELSNSQLLYGTDSNLLSSATSQSHQPRFDRSVPTEASGLDVIPEERFFRIEQLWSPKRSRQPCSVRQFWQCIIYHQGAQLFTDPSLVQDVQSSPDTVLDLDDGGVDPCNYGFDDQCRNRLLSLCDDKAGTSPMPFQNPSIRGRRASSDAHPVRPSELPPEPALPSSEILGMSLSLYFRRFHILLPFIHHPTFSAATTDSAVLFPMCLIGLSFLDEDTARRFVCAQTSVGHSCPATTM